MNPFVSRVVKQVEGKVTIRALDNNEFMYADSKIFKIDSRAGRVFTYIPQKMRKEAIWIIEPTSKKDMVLIKNFYFNGYLYSGELYYDKKDVQRRSVFVCFDDRPMTNDESFYWKLLPIQGHIYQISNHLGEVLYGTTGWFNLKSDRRLVFTCKESKMPKPKTSTGLFEIVNCDSEK